MRLKKAWGFTLVELLVAIAIFAVLSALGWKVFDYIAKVKTQNAMHESKLGQLQESYQQILRDTVQAVPLTANIAGQVQAALTLQNSKLAFSKTGVTDPLNQGVAADERVEYVYRQDEQKLYRLKYPNINQSGRDQPDSSVLLNGVEQYQITVLNPNELTTWPDSVGNLSSDAEKQRLPRGLKLNLTVNGVSYEWIFSLLNTDFLEEKKTVSTPDGNQGVSS
ncbi:prepilin-type N-terminal cleavage/methylation domain-containing protein [Acinetobacter cumulans]|jgi:general secretion pathway protein J|uniref:Type II secretion system protein J n=1 Tax=Acinetobacter cumulans TaxID=2136182 RepID=A0ABX9U8M4_9GAMM|nr:type II secretion system protein GspJ [Acinetobacter cumulans]RLL48901.1 prepilin-type N-terminal cleavage/methylation domain-containing protein [Acinetobacter cumulans]